MPKTLLLAVFVLGWLASTALGYYHCRQYAFQAFCDKIYFGTHHKIELLDFNKNDGAL